MHVVFKLFNYLHCISTPATYHLTDSATLSLLQPVSRCRYRENGRTSFVVPSCFCDEMNQSTLRKGGGGGLVCHPESHQMMCRRKNVGKRGCFTSEASDLQLLQSDHPSREETRIFTALIQVGRVPDGYSGPRQSGRKQRGSKPKNFQVRLMSAFMEGWRGESLCRNLKGLCAN